VGFEVMTGKPSAHRWIWKSATVVPTNCVDFKTTTLSGAVPDTVS